MMIPIRWPAANVKSSGSVGNVKRYLFPIVTGSAVRSELRFEESIMPLVTRHWVTVCCGLPVTMKHGMSSGTCSPWHVLGGFVLAGGVEMPSPLRLVCVLGP